MFVFLSICSNWICVTRGDHWNTRFRLIISFDDHHLLCNREGERESWNAKLPVMLHWWFPLWSFCDSLSFSFYTIWFLSVLLFCWNLSSCLQILTEDDPKEWYWLDHGWCDGKHQHHHPFPAFLGGEGRKRRHVLSEERERDLKAWVTDFCSLCLFRTRDENS